MFDRPYRRRRRLTGIERQAVEFRERTTEGMYACGHRNGALMALWPGDILTLSHAIRVDAGFNVFFRVGDPCSYEENEELELSVDDAERWLGETNLMSQILNDSRRTAGERIQEFLRIAVRPADLIRLGWEVPPHSIPAFQSADGAATTTQTMFTSRMEGVLADVLSLCVTSALTRNPIRLAL